MAKLPQAIDASQIEPAKPLGIIPAGKYPVKMTDSEMKPTAAGDGGAYCAAEFTIISGEYAGRKLYDNWNLINKNATAMEIAYKTLSAVCHAVGVYQVSDTQALHDKPLIAVVGIQPAGNDRQGVMREARNDIKGYEALESGTVADAATSGNLPPWAASPAAAPVPAAAPSLPAPEPVKKMTDKAAGAEYKDFIKNGWTEGQMIAEGYMVLENPAPAPSATPPWQQPAAPVAPAVPSSTSVAKAPWER